MIGMISVAVLMLSSAVLVLVHAVDISQITQGELIHEAVLCSPTIVQHATTVSLTDPSGLYLPYGRSFMAHRFSQAIYFHDVDILRNLVRARSCYIDRNHTHSRQHLRQVCTELKLHALLIGKELIDPLFIDVKIMHEHTNYPICEWNLVFPRSLAEGDYELLIWTHSFNEFREPTEAERHAAKDDRHNNGESISISGLGMIDYFDLYPFQTHNFTGHIVRKVYTNEFYLMVNQTAMRRLPNESAIALYGFTHDHYLWCSQGFFKFAKEMFPSLNDTNYMLFNQISETFFDYDHRSRMMERLKLYFRAKSFNESLIFSLPNRIHIERPMQSQWQSPRWNQLCRDTVNSSSVSRGRWVFINECDSHLPSLTIKEMELYHKRIVSGERCMQTQPIETEYLPNRLTGYVWMPWNCNLIEMDARQLFVQIGKESQITANLFNEIIDSIETSNVSNGNSNNNLRFSVAAQQYTKGLLYTNHSDGDTKANAKLPSVGTPLALCLKSKGVGMIAAFGDSLGNEQWCNFQFLLGQAGLNTWTDEKHSITCSGNSANPIHSITMGKEMVACIESQVDEMMKAESTQRQISLIDNYPNSPKVPVSTVLLITNLMVQHATSGHYLALCESSLKELGMLHQQLADRLMAKYRIRYRRVYMSGVSIHGFRVTGLTNSRQEWFNRKAREHLTNFEMWDVYNITASRPDATADGTHYPEGVSKALTDTLANMLCIGDN